MLNFFSSGSMTFFLKNLHVDVHVCEQNNSFNQCSCKDDPQFSEYLSFSDTLETVQLASAAERASQMRANSVLDAAPWHLRCLFRLEKEILLLLFRYFEYIAESEPVTSSWISPRSLSLS